MSATSQAEANKQLVLDFFREVMAARETPVFMVAENDLVSVCFYMPQPEPGSPGQTYDFFSFNTYRIRDGKLAERWSNVHKYVPLHLPPDPAVGRDRGTRPGGVGVTDLEANKQLVRDFYARVFGVMDAGAVRDFVAEGYRQHSSHMPQGRSGLEEYVAAIATAAPPTAGPAPATPPPLPEPDVLLAEGDIVVIAACLPQPEPDGSGATWPYYAYDAYRVKDGKLAEHWSGINKAAPPRHG